MDTNHPSLQLLAPFDHWDGAAVVSSAPVSKRGILWVLKWAATAASIVCATTMLAEFAYSLAAEQMLARAARAGVFEATLPRATVHSVHQAIGRRMAGRGSLTGELSIVLLDNGAPVTKKFQPRGGDRLSITLRTPAHAVMPTWLRALTAWRGETKIIAHFERIVPGKHLAASKN